MQVRDFFRLWLWVRSRGRISIGPKCRIERGAVLDLREAGRITVGRKCRLRRGSMLIPYGGVISIGDDFSLNPYSVLYGHGGLSIGNSVRIAAGCVIIPANHVFSDPGTAIRAQGLTKLGIVIEDDVWVGANVTILDGAHISRVCNCRRLRRPGPDGTFGHLRRCPGQAHQETRKNRDEGGRAMRNLLLSVVRNDASTLDSHASNATLRAR